MKYFNKYILIVIIIALNSTTYGMSDPNLSSKRELKFEFNDQPQSWHVNRDGSNSLHSARQGPGIIVPNYVVELYLMNVHQILNDIEFPRSYPFNTEKQTRFEKFLLEQISISDSQKELLRHGSYIGAGSNPVSGLYAVKRLFAVSEKDAQEMAQGMLNFLDSQVNDAWERTQKAMEENKQKVLIIKKRIIEIEEEIRSASSGLENIKKSSKYEAPEDAKKEIAELDIILTKLEVEIAGLQAKVETIRKYMGQGTPETQAITHQMLICQEVDLAGALAQKYTAEITRNKAQNYIDYIENLKSARKDYNTELSKLKKTENSIQTLKKIILDPPAFMQPIELYKNKAVIYPVKKGGK